jgi:plastocyanin
MEEGARRLQRLGVACLILAAVMAPPALSAAQDDGSAGQPAPAVTPPAPATPAPAPTEPADTAVGNKPDAGKEDEADKSGADSAAEAAAPAPALAVATTAKKQPKAVAAASALVSTGDNFYSPRTVSIAVGDTVTWRNTGQAQHSATANNGSFDTGVFDSGQSRSHTFSTAGTFSYFCTVHGSAQSGTVRVAAASGGGGGGGDDDASASQSEADAVASPDAAGDSNTLPMTGYASGALVLIGLMLPAAGAVVRRFEDEKRRPFFSFPLR